MCDGQLYLFVDFVLEYCSLHHFGFECTYLIHLPKLCDVANIVIVGRPSKCRQLLLKNAKVVVKLLANNAGSCDV